MSRLALQEYLNDRIKNVKYYIEFNERKTDKDFFAHKELELYQMAEKYMQLTNELGCPLDVVFKALKEGIIDEENRDRDIMLVRSKKGYWFREFSEDLPRLWIKDYKKTWWLPSDLQKDE